MALNKDKLISGIADSYLVGLPETLSESDKIKANIYAKMMAETIATAIHEYLLEAEIQVSEGVTVGTGASGTDKLKTLEKGKGKIF